MIGRTPRITLFRDLPSERWFSMERYADELYAALAGLGADVRQYVLPRPLPQLRGPAGAWFNHVWRLLAYPLAARRQQSEVNHIVDHSYAHLLGALDSTRTMVTCHDLAPLAVGGRRRGLSHQLWQHSFRALPRAARIGCDSEHTRSELQRHASVPDSRLCVIPLGVRAPDPAPAAAQRQPGMVLHVGACEPRKNLPLLLRALAGLPQARLVQAGGRPDPALRALSEALGVAGRVQWLGPISEAQLHLLYRTASVLALPSLYEGFGLPVLEAMAAGLPVVCSRATSLPEVAGDAALLFDPTDAAELGGLLHTVLADAAVQARLSEAGRARCRLFTWENTARATLAAYQQIRP